MTAVASSIPGFTGSVFTRDYSLVYSLGNSTLFLSSQFENSVTELVSTAYVITLNHYLSSTFTWSCATVNGSDEACVQCPVTAQTTSQDNGVVTYYTGTMNNLTLTFSESDLAFGCEYVVDASVELQYTRTTGTVLAAPATAVSSNVIQPSADWTEETLRQVLISYLRFFILAFQWIYVGIMKLTICFSQLCSVYCCRREEGCGWRQWASFPLGSMCSAPHGRH